MAKQIHDWANIKSRVWHKTSKLISPDCVPCIVAWFMKGTAKYPFEQLITFLVNIIFHCGHVVIQIFFQLIE